MKVAVIGSFAVDLMARTPHFPEPGETVLGSFFKAGPGGKGSNQAIAAKRAGADLIFSTKIGRDDFANIALESFRSNDIALNHVFQAKNVPTGAALISVSELTCQNEIIVVPGACSTYTDEDITGLEAALEGCSYLLLQLEINMDATEKLINLAYGKGIRVILNPAPIHPFSEKLYNELYLITPNEMEAQILTKVSCDTPLGCAKAAEVFFSKGVEKVIITLGNRGIYFNDRVNDYILPNYDVAVMDTTGAGDAFNGGMLAGLSKGLPLDKAVLYGNVVSNLAVTRLGTAPAMPYSHEIEQFIQLYGLSL
jgi:ribokinase